MTHARRRFCAGDAASAEDLAMKLTDRTWTLCTAFRLGGYLFLNDSTSEDGAQDYAVVKTPAAPSGPHRQVESMTFGWCDSDKVLGYTRKCLAGDYDGEAPAPATLAVEEAATALNEPRTVPERF